MSDLHASIMNLRCVLPGAEEYELRYGNTSDTKEWDAGYKYGHRDARHAAAELANEYAASYQRLKAVVDRLLALPVAQNELRMLDKGIGTKTVSAVWLDAREALRSAP